VPALHLLERLLQRNEWLIGSHHPLRETIMAQTGRNESERRAFLQMTYHEAKAALIHTWAPPDLEEPAI